MATIGTTGVGFPTRVLIFLFTAPSRSTLGPARRLCCEVKGRGTDHSPPHKAVITLKYAWSSTSPLPHIFIR